MANNNPHNLWRGQQIWFVPGSRVFGAPGFATVICIGRKWATIKRDWKECRIDLTTLLEDTANKYSAGRAYLDKEAYEAKLAREDAFMDLRLQLSRQSSSPAETVTEQNIRDAAILLGIELKQRKNG
ncbi:hypothetical protein [Uliginosibacterium sediminicola]|uniref:Uncharacterized protein n=1 Tax=Uliginosibacterium sediminicola TaxID=2024550 RepID=A0ABU9YVX0_9RHOO